MIIASKFRDYYDSISTYGIDKTCVYQRAEFVLKGEFEVPGNRWSHWPYEEEFAKVKSGAKSTYRVSKFVIGFCGNLYPVVIIEKEKKDKKETFAFYNVGKILAFIAKENIDVEPRYSYYSSREFTIKSESSLKNFFDVTNFSKLKDQFHNHLCPVFVYGRFSTTESGIRKTEKLILNPRLKNYRFVQVKEPQIAFQELYMYLSGVIGSSAPAMVEIKDKELAEKRGHGDRYSFKKPPGKRGKKQWR